MARAEQIEENAWAKIDSDGFSMNIEINEVVLASYVIGVLLDLL